MNRFIKFVLASLWIILVVLVIIFLKNNLKGNIKEEHNLIFNCEDFSINKGSTVSLEAKIDPNKNNLSLVWESSNPDVLSVNDGVFTALDFGDATITVKIDNTDLVKSCKISVVNDIIDILKIEVNEKNITLLKKDKYTLNVTITPSNASNKNLIWESSNEKIVKVNNGVITAVGAGSATITATTLDGSKNLKTNVTVTDNDTNNSANNNNTNTNNNTNSTNNTNTNTNNNTNSNSDGIAVSGINLNTTSLIMKLNETKTITPTIVPSNASNKSLIWESSNEKIVKVNNGIITAVGVGSATVTATSLNGKKATCNIKVNSLDRIHFIGNGTAFTTFVNSNSSGKGPSPSETILLESNGKFALIDTGLSNNNSLNKNRATNVVNYLRKTGVKELEFILITHAHYDHTGGAPYIIDNISTKKLYMKVYYGNDKDSEGEKNSNVNAYNNLYNKASKKGIYEKINTNFEGKILFLGNMQIKLLATKNLQYYDECYGEDENINSIITYITINNKKILLTGDMEEPKNIKCLKKFDSSCSVTSITECVINKNNIKNIDLLKLPHHGYSSCDINNNIVNNLNPKYIVIGNWSSKVNYYYKGIQNNNGLTLGPVYNGFKSCRSQYFLNYSTSGNNKRAFYVNNNNVVFDFSNANISIYNN